MKTITAEHALSLVHQLHALSYSVEYTREGGHGPCNDPRARGKERWMSRKWHLPCLAAVLGAPLNWCSDKMREVFALCDVML